MINTATERRQVFKRQRGQWVAGLVTYHDHKVRVLEWVQSDFAQGLLNNSVSATESAMISNPSKPTP
jgi:hypothetical protein